MDIKKQPLISASHSDFTLEALRQIAPSAFTEVRGADGELTHKVNFDVLRELLGDAIADADEETFGFQWVGKQAAKRAAAEPTRQTLRPIVEDSVDWDTTENLYIEGDNLEVLKLLQRAYLGKVKMIYIDPPYNTGNDFVYDDDFAMSREEMDEAMGNIDEEGNRLRRNLDSNPRYHSDWCSMIYSRLLVARTLLANDGVIFISIDDNEVHHLRKICDEVFGAENFVSNIHCQLSTTQGMKVKAAQMGNIVKNAEYILCYSKNGDKTIGKQLLYDLRDKYDEHYSLYLRKDGSIGQLKELYDYRYPKDCSNKKPYKLAQAYAKSEEFADIVRSHLADIVRSHLADISHSDKVTGINDTSIENGFWTEVTRNDKTYLLTRDNKGQIRQLLRLSDSWGNTDGYSEEQGLRKIRGDWWEGFYIDMGNVSKEGGVDFKNGKKPLRLIKQLIKFVTPYADPDSLILDFFSGSATTAHAVMQLNAEDGGKRKYIMVQLPEETPQGSEARKAGYNTICEIGKERIRRAGAEIRRKMLGDRELPLTSNDSSLTSELDTGFRVFRVDSSNMEEVYFEPAKLKQDDLFSQVDSVKPDRSELDLLFGCMVDWGVELSYPLSKEEVAGKHLHIVNEGALVACFDKDINLEVIGHIAAMKPLRVILRESCFEKDADKLNVYEQFKQLCGWSDDETYRRIHVI